MNYFVEFIELIQNTLENEHEVLIVEKILENLDDLCQLKVEDLALETYSSSGTIIRFIQRLGFASYSDFKNKVYKDYCAYTFEDKQYLDIQKSLQNQLESYHQSISNIDMQRMLDLAILMSKVKSVTLVANDRHLEDLHVLQLTLMAYDIPCFRYHNRKSFNEHITLLGEDDLVLYVQDKEEYQSIIQLNTKPKKALLQVNDSKKVQFSEEETYLLIKSGKDVDASMLIIGQIFYYYISYVMEVMK